MRFTTIGLLVLALLLVSCASSNPNLCPDVPQMSDRETIKDYTVRLINQYKTCKASKAKPADEGAKL